MTPSAPHDDPAASALQRLRAQLGVAAKSLKLQIAAGGVFALAVAIAASTLMFLNRAERDLLATAERVEISEAVRDARMLDAQVAQLLASLGFLAVQASTLTPGDVPALRGLIESKPSLRSSFDNVALISSSGEVQLHWDARGFREPRVNVADRGYFRRALQERRAIVSEVVEGRISAEPIVVLAHPIVRDGEVQGLLAGTLLLQRRGVAQALTEAKVEDAADQLVVVTDARARIVGHPDRERIGDPLAAEPRLAAALLRWREMGHPLEPMAVTIPDATALVTAAAVPGSEWLVWRWHDRAAVLAPLRTARSDVLRLSVLLTVTMGALFVLGLWWLLRPLSQLQQRSRHLFDGTIAPHEGWPRAGGEIGALAGVLQQVSSERADLETRNTQVLMRLQSVMDAAPVGIAITREGRYELVSREMCRLLGREESLLLGLPAAMIFASLQEYQDLGVRVGVAFAAGLAFDGELEFVRGDGSRFPGRLRGLPVEPGNASGPRGGTIWTLTDITAEVADRRSLEWAAEHDALTGLYNRKALERAMAKAFAQRSAVTAPVLLLLDLDRFKPVNDTHGHAAGDAVLQAVATALQQGLRADDFAARLGGDEFAVLLPGCPPDVAQRLAEKLRASISALAVPWHGHVLGVGASVGLAALGPGHASAQEWMAAADRACYGAKSGGRDRVCSSDAKAGLRLVSGAGV